MSGCELGVIFKTIRKAAHSKLLHMKLSKSTQVECDIDDDPYATADKNVA